MGESIRSERREGYRIIALNRPERQNAFDTAMHGALGSALEEAERDSACRAILLTGTGRAFCAGQDLAEITSGGAAADLSELIERQYNKLIRRIGALPMPVVCAVNGAQFTTKSAARASFSSSSGSPT